MFVRDGNNNPREIAKIFVRDAAGNPQEISKIYVRDAAGNPKLVFDNTVIIVENFCPTCGNTIFRIEPVAQPPTPAAVSNRIRLTDEAIGQAGDNTNSWIPNTTTSSLTSAPFSPTYTVNKDYWSKVALSFDYTVVTESGAPIGTSQAPTGFFNTFGPQGTINFISMYTLQFTQSQPGDGGTSQANQLANPSAAEYASGSSWYWNKINSIFATHINYPILPGYIIVDWNTYTVRDTLLVVMKDPQRTFDSHCGSPVVPDGSGFQPPPVSGCPETGVRNSSIYPFHNRTIITKVQEFDSSDIFSAKCGQNYCFDVFSTVFVSAESECFNQRLINYVDRAGTIVTGNCTGGIDGAGSNGIGQVGIDDVCDSNVYINWNEVEQGIINPFSFIVNKENHGTGRTLPTQLANAEPQDCCPSTCYGPVPMKAAPSSQTITACRQVYQIPPINTINADGLDRLGFFENIYTSLLMGAESIAGTQGIGSLADIRIVLPCYVNLHVDFTNSIVKVFPSQYDAFVNNGLGPTGAAANIVRDKTVWEAVKSFMPYVPGTITISDPTKRNWLSSVHFHYNEDRTFSGLGAPFNRAPDGISVSTPNGFPTLLWNISGYPTEQSTHYIVLELSFQANDVCVSNAFNILQLQTPENQKFFILGMRFYPVSRNGHKHPIFRDHIIPANVQAFANNTTNAGFIDYYAGAQNQNLPTVDQIGEAAGLNVGQWFTTNVIQTTAFANGTTIVNAFKIPNCTNSNNFCQGIYGIKYPAIGTMKKFLAKYYQLPINT